MALQHRNKRRPGNDAEPRDRVDLAPGALVGEYEIERKLGEGSMGVVYAAIHTVLGKRCALKIISHELSRDAEAMARFRREARVVAQLQSPHVIGAFGFGELPDGRSYFVMEYLTGESLGTRLERGRVPLDEALDILEQTARGLEAAHAAGVVHRDLKPDNIFLERHGSALSVKLLDFGIVKVAADDRIAKTQAGVLVGTPLYMAPEQIAHAGEVDPRADIYALGGVAFELVLGRVAFPYATVIELVAAHLTAAPPSPRSIWPEIPAALDALLTAMLVKEPAKRPTLGHVLDAIEKLRRSAFVPVKPSEALSEGRAAGSGRPSRRRRVAAITGVAGAVGAGALAFALVRGHGQPAPVAPSSVPVAATHDDDVRVSPIEVPAMPAPSAPVNAPPPPAASSRPVAASKPGPSSSPPAKQTRSANFVDARTAAAPPVKGPPRAPRVNPDGTLNPFTGGAVPDGTLNPFAAKGSGR